MKFNKNLNPFFTSFDIHEEYRYEYFNEGFNTKVGKLYPYAWKCMYADRIWFNGLWKEQFNWLEDSAYVCWIKCHKCI